MAGFEGVTPQAVEKVTPAHQPDAKWPVFLFALGDFGSEKGGDELEEADPSLSQAEAEAAAADEAAAEGGLVWGASSGGAYGERDFAKLFAHEELVRRGGGAVEEGAGEGAVRSGVLNPPRA